MRALPRAGALVTQYAVYGPLFAMLALLARIGVAVVFAVPSDQAIRVSQARRSASLRSPMRSFCEFTCTVESTTTDILAFIQCDDSRRDAGRPRPERPTHVVGRSRG